MSQKMKVEPSLINNYPYNPILDHIQPDWIEPCCLNEHIMYIQDHPYTQISNISSISNCAIKKHPAIIIRFRARQP